MLKAEDSLRHRIDAGERSFEAEDLDDMCHDLRDMSLGGINFNRAFLVASFRGSNLKQASFINSNVKTCDFSGADLRQANFAGAAIDWAVFTEAQLEGAEFQGATEQGHVYGQGELPWSR